MKSATFFALNCHILTISSRQGPRNKWQVKGELVKVIGLSTTAVDL